MGICNCELTGVSSKGGFHGGESGGRVYMHAYILERTLTLIVYNLRESTHGIRNRSSQHQVNLQGMIRVKSRINCDASFFEFSIL